MIAAEPVRTLDAFERAAAAVAEVLRTTTDWGPSGERAGQYAVDLDADAACLDVLYTAGFRVLSEESGITAPAGVSSTAPVVVVDPVDGSTNASRHLPWCATALCCVDDDGAAVAMVVNQATGDVHTAVRGSGAELNGVACRPSSVTAMGDAIVGVSGLPTHHYGWAQFRAMGASAPDICNVASGVLDAWCDMNAGHGVWDYLASTLIVTEAGGVVAEVFDRELCVLDHTARRAPAAAATPELLAAVLAERRR